MPANESALKVLYEERHCIGNFTEKWYRQPYTVKGSTYGDDVETMTVDVLATIRIFDLPELDRVLVEYSFKTPSYSGDVLAAKDYDTQYDVKAKPHFMSGAQSTRWYVALADSWIALAEGVLPDSDNRTKEMVKADYLATLGEYTFGSGPELAEAA